MSGFISVAYFLVSLFFNLVLFVLWLRLILRYFRISALHPISLAIYGLTNPLLQPIERTLYPAKAPIKRYDWVGLGSIIIIEFLKFISISLILLGTLFPFAYLLLFVAADLIVQPCNLLFYCILIRVIMSWVNPAWNHPAADILKLITEPLLRWGRKIIPDISGFDFSPMIIMIILKVITLFISASMPLNIV